MKDKPGNDDLLFRVLADAQDRYASRIIPYVTPPINNPEKKGNIHNLVMGISKDILNTERNITGDQLYPAIDTVEELYQKKRSYVGTIMPNRIGLPVLLKTAKRREVLSSEFMWKKNSPIMIVLYCPKPNKNVLLVSTAHGEPDVCGAPHKKPMVIDFYNSQRCGVDIINQMLCDYSCQPTCDSWVVLVFTFILDLAAVNARTILKYNKKNYIHSRRDFLENLPTYLIIPYGKTRTKVTNLKSVAISPINDVLESCSVSVLRDDPENQDLPIEDNGILPNEGPDIKCHVYVKNLQDTKDEETH